MFDITCPVLVETDRRRQVAGNQATVADAVIAELSRARRRLVGG